MFPKILKNGNLAPDPQFSKNVFHTMPVRFEGALKHFCQDEPSTSFVKMNPQPVLSR